MRTEDRMSIDRRAKVPRRAAIVVALLAAVVFLVPLGGDSEIEKRVYPDRIEHSTVHELWSLGTLAVFGTLVGESHLTRTTIVLGLAGTLSLAASAYGATRGVINLRRTRAASHRDRG